MSKMISVASGFQYSVNIAFDLNNDDKIKNFIPTQPALDLLEDVLASTNPLSSERARVLIGAYGKGKSHIVLVILSMLMKKNISLFDSIVSKASGNLRLKQLIDNYYDSDNKILPIVVTGSNTSLTQAFLNALQRALSDNDLMDVMPDTNYKAAISVIKRWRREFPDTYKQFEKLIDIPVNDFEKQLAEYCITTYEQFDRLYPQLTAGSIFNPFLGFDVVELYEQVANVIKAKGYTGVYVIYDEFSKYLEANIQEASISDTKMLQDFAEKCNRSGSLQMHLMLICHKEISNYIDKLPKQKVDGWRGVSERFKHIHMNNNYAQTYEVISSVINIDKECWNEFVNEYSADFSELLHRYSNHPIFSDLGASASAAIYGCYPLSPVTTFILPRLSEKVAQNERTLFTFLSVEGKFTLSSFLSTYNDDNFSIILPDMIYDYFSPLLKKEACGSDIYNTYVLTEHILQKLSEESLESKIVKTISLMYILELFECLEPTREELIGIFAAQYEIAEINQAIQDLIEKELVVYLKRSNDYLRLKHSSGIDIRQQISDSIATHYGKISVKGTLNKSNFDNYMYPARYNDEREMTRYFAFEFIDEDEVAEDVDWNLKSSRINADGVIYGILVHSEAAIDLVKKALYKNNMGKQCIFVVPKHYSEITHIVREYNAAYTLRERAIEDPVLFDEYDVIVEDLGEIIRDFIFSYTHPESCKSTYFYNGDEVTIRRKAALTELMSSICDNTFGMTPVINNEAVNKNEITSIATKSRNKIVAALLRNELEPNLGLSGRGQDVSMMRSTLIRTGIWIEGDIPMINLRPEDKYIANMLHEIEEFIVSARKQETTRFSELYETLIEPRGNIGLRRSVIPIYLAAVIHEYKKQIVILDRYGQVPINAETLVQINSDPEAFSIAYLDWNEDKEEYISKLSRVFADFVIEAEKGANYYDYISNAMKRWYLSLPKYSKEIRKLPSGTKIDKKYTSVIKLLKQNVNSYELLFAKLPEVFGYSEGFNYDVIENISVVKTFYDNLIIELKHYLISALKEMFVLPNMSSSINKMSLASVIIEWCDSLEQKVFEQLFSDRSNRFLQLCKNITNDEETFITELAKLATDLRIDDWGSDTIERYFENVLQYKNTAESFVLNNIEESDRGTASYQVSFTDDKGDMVTKRFDSVEFTGRGKLLLNQINASLDAMGCSISEQEKRQILMEVLKKIC